MLASCSSNTYPPKSQFTRSFRAKNEVIAGGTLGKSIKSANLGYSLFNHFGYIYQINLHGEYYGIGEQLVHSHNAIFFSDKELLHLSLASGLDHGYIDNSNVNGRLHLTRSFVQPAIGIHRGLIDATIAAQVLKTSYHYKNGKNETRPPELWENEHLFLEPSFSLGLNHGKTRMQIQLIGAHRLTNHWIQYESKPQVNLSFSYNFQFDEFFRTIKD